MEEFLDRPVVFEGLLLRLEKTADGFRTVSWRDGAWVPAPGGFIRLFEGRFATPEELREAGVPPSPGAPTETAD
jgi:hypothetical protein